MIYTAKASGWIKVFEAPNKRVALAEAKASATSASLLPSDITEVHPATEEEIRWYEAMAGELITESTPMKCWKVITAHPIRGKRFHYLRAETREDAASEIRPLGTVSDIPWNIISIKECSEAELVRNTDRR
jgi:uncharacterized protein YifE (UPF0438 family)